ncbi:alpha/beta fold hydrolase [Pikeienuella piscinae]|uniref:Alpha/beta fold hydrolase n=1 Tax=Pikeienuella piscinae TaxID=2748098 RepID=A0A7L5BVK8_9RHOB|nr:alpha/beta fold hydrolase [Pikeienuella piscinae]QIE56400.1 alpha/beta fold hydrolase [Pikeienuella piscinae]
MRGGARGFARRCWTLGILIPLSACAPEPKAPNLDTLYDSAASFESQERNPVISIPGTLGSRLVDTESGVVVWGGANGLSVDPDDPENARLIALPIGEGDERLRELRDNLRPDGVLRVARASILGIPVELDIYRGVIETLIAGGFDFRETREEEKTEREINLDSFEFPYDWRRDIVEAASDLDYFVKRKNEQVRETRRSVFGGDPKPVTFDLIAHSMGGLVARYYLMYGGADLPEDGSLPEVTWAGAKNVNRAIFIAPPNTGSVLSFENLVNGKTLGPFQPTYEPALLGTHVSTYELFPRDRHRRVKIKGSDEFVSLFDVDMWDRYEWGILNPSQDPVLKILMPDEPTAASRRARAKRHLAKILARAEQFQRAMDRPVDVPEWLDLYLVVGGGFETPAAVEFDPENGHVDIVKLEEGDGVVLRASSLLDERQDGDYALGLRSPVQYRSVLLLPEEHVDITKSAVFGDNLLFWLLEAPRVGDQLAQPKRLSLAGAPSSGDAATSPPAEK